MYVEQARNALKSEGMGIPGERLAHVSPLGREHLGLTGADLWRIEEVPLPGTFRKLNGGGACWRVNFPERCKLPGSGRDP
ncbi:hypothetical protein HLB42_18175 (plasmid) [Deinococcus sp. D7000]|nr:hypothetical protein HLB42_18175 [Deinococcus sp. D7000]